jgi:hypothetical protein
MVTGGWVFPWPPEEGIADSFCEQAATLQFRNPASKLRSNSNILRCTFMESSLLLSKKHTEDNIKES